MTHPVATPFNLVLAVALAVASIAGFVLVPAGVDLPVHWGVTGAADGFLPRDLALLLLPAIAVLVLGLLVWVRRSAAAAGGRQALTTAMSVLLGLFVVVQTAIVMIGVGIAVDMVRIVVLALGVVFVVLGNIMPKTQPNGVVGIRLPWTLADAANWQATNRLGGWLMLLGGLLMACTALLSGQPAILLTATAIGVIVPILVATLFSYRLAHRK
ncbi:MAG: hypothetical protein BGO82_19940 [Devosia sp. 67-54]|uniref:SdpI family protein n=1 Tax=unclassified Devosia TaxID=196773 RepID=UPI0009694D1F|nr:MULTISPECIES: SdpI family protein [unclassified Devosia]MBN9306367.1 SdpI family protein [Devosia sp.]OJX18429.1 MAG: hypothetical protein BGO82_19940 [Devosia sp. 67-54]